MADYYVVKRGLLDMPSLFSAASGRRTASNRTCTLLERHQLPRLRCVHCRYRYDRRRFRRVFSVQRVSVAAQRMYILAYPIGFLVSGMVYVRCARCGRYGGCEREGA